MSKGFILGKFLPLHKGHLELIDFALNHCDLLYIIICFSPKESICGAIRMQWLQKELQHLENVVLISFPYKENVLPNTSDSSRTVSKKWAEALKIIIPNVDVVFSSEPYGSYLAEYMNIKHILFDQKRLIVPVSGSQIRKQPFRYWDYIADAAKSYFIKKISIVGSESTGKSTLAKKLARYFNTNFVPEMAREIMEKTNDCTFRHLEQIATLHANTIRKEGIKANKLLFLDTDINITKSYSRFLFNKDLHVDSWINETNKADLYLFLTPDCPYIQDGTRLTETERNKLSLFHIEELKKNNFNFITISGDWDERFDSAVEIIKKRYF